MNFLNSKTGYALFSYEALKDAYIDKSLLIHEIYRYVHKTNKYICITRPRRFGKSVAANMIAAFLIKAHQKRADNSLKLWRSASSRPLRKKSGKQASLFLHAPLNKSARPGLFAGLSRENTRLSAST